MSPFSTLLCKARNACPEDSTYLRRAREAGGFPWNPQVELLSEARTGPDRGLLC